MSCSTCEHLQGTCLNSCIKFPNLFQKFPPFTNTGKERILYDPVPNEVESLDRHFKLNELVFVINKSKIDKATGPDGVPYEVYKNSSLNFQLALLDYFNYLNTAASLPDSFGKSVIYLLYKEGNVNGFRNYRGVSFFRLFSQIIHGHVTKKT